jgi:hypothetical protein
MAKGNDTRNHSNRRVDLYVYKNKFKTALNKHIQSDSSDYVSILTSEGYLTPNGKVTGAGRLNPMARTELNWNK